MRAGRIGRERQRINENQQFDAPIGGTGAAGHAARLGHARKRLEHLLCSDGFLLPAALRPRGNAALQAGRK